MVIHWIVSCVCLYLFVPARFIKSVIFIWTTFSASVLWLTYDKLNTIFGNRQIQHWDMFIYGLCSLMQCNRTMPVILSMNAHIRHACMQAKESVLSSPYGIESKGKRKMVIYLEKGNHVPYRRYCQKTHICTREHFMTILRFEWAFFINFHSLVWQKRKSEENFPRSFKRCISLFTRDFDEHNPNMIHIRTHMVSLKPEPKRPKKRGWDGGWDSFLSFD